MPSRYYQDPVGSGSASYPGSSGYWGDTGGSGWRSDMGYPGDRYRVAAGVAPLDPTMRGQATQEGPVWDSQTGQWVGHKSGKPYTGKLPNGLYASNGVATRNDPNAAPKIDPNDPNQRYKPVDITKQPDIAGETSDLLKQFKDGADKTLKGFDDYVNEFKSAAGSAISKQQKSTDVGPVTGALAGAQSRYAGSLNQDSQDYQTLNQNTAAAETGIVDRANKMLGDYDTAFNNAENLAQQRVTGAVSRYGAGKNASAGGVNMGMGGDIASIAAQKSYEASLPYEQAKINKRYDILQNLDLPVQRDIASRETSRIAQFNPAVAASIYGSDQDTQLKIHSLKSAAAQQDWQTALEILKVPEIAAQVRNQIMAGDTSLLGALSQLESQSHYQGLQDLLGINVSQPQYFSPGNLNYPPAPSGGGRSRYDFGNGGTATGNGGAGLPANNAPVTVNPNTAGMPPGATQVDYAYFKQTGVWPQQDPNFSQETYNSIAAQFKNAGSRYSQGSGYANGSQAWRNYRYDPQSGLYYDNATGAVVNMPNPNSAYQGDAESNPALEGMA